MRINKKILQSKKKEKESNYLVLEGVKTTQKRKATITYINNLLASIELFNREELIKIIKNIKDKLE